MCEIFILFKCCNVWLYCSNGCVCFVCFLYGGFSIGFEEIWLMRVFLLINILLDFLYKEIWVEVWFGVLSIVNLGKELIWFFFFIVCVNDLL